MSEPEVLSDAYVRSWSTVCRFASILSFLPVPVIVVLFALKMISFKTFDGHVPTMLLLIAISIVFDMRRRSLLENQTLLRSITGGKQD